MTPPSPPYPAAERLDLVEHLHGTPVADPYRWLEDGADPRTAAWSAAQDDLFGAAAPEWPGREKTQVRLTELLAAGMVGVPTWRGDRRFFVRRTGDQEHAVLLVAEPDPDRGNGAERERVLIDPVALDPEGLTTLDHWQPNREGTLLAYQLSEGGTEESVLRVHGRRQRRRRRRPDRPRPLLPGGLAAGRARRRAGVLLRPAAAARGGPGGRGPVPPAGLAAPARHRPRGRRPGVRRRPRPAHLLRRLGVARTAAGCWSPRRSAPRPATTCGSPTSRRAGRRSGEPAARRGGGPGVRARAGRRRRAGRPARRPRRPALRVHRPRRARAAASSSRRRTRRARSTGATWCRTTPRRCWRASRSSTAPELDRPLLLVAWTRHAVAEVTVHDLATGERLEGDRGHRRPAGPRQRSAGSWRGRRAATRRGSATPTTRRRRTSTGTTAATARCRCGAARPGRCPCRTSSPGRSRTRRRTAPRSACSSSRGRTCWTPGGRPRRAPAADRPLRLRRLQRPADAGVLGDDPRPGRRPAGSTRSRTCAAGPRRARSGTAPGCSAPSRTCSTTSTPPPSASSRTAGRRPTGWRSAAAPTAGCWSAPR